MNNNAVIHMDGNLAGMLLELKTEIFNQEWLFTNNITNTFAIAPYNVETVNMILTELEIKPILIEKKPVDHLISTTFSILLTTFLFGKILYSFSEEDVEKLRIIMRIYSNE